MPKEATVVGIVIFCSDPRAGLWKKIKQELIQPEEMFAKVGVLGGPISLANPEHLPTECNFLLAQIHFVLGTLPDITRLVVIGHDCGFYKQITHKKVTLNDKKEDLAKAAVFLKEHFPGLATTAFFENGRGFDFERI